MASWSTGRYCSRPPGFSARPEVRCKTPPYRLIGRAGDLGLYLGVLIAPTRGRNACSAVQALNGSGQVLIAPTRGRNRIPSRSSRAIPCVLIAPTRGRNSAEDSVVDGPVDASSSPLRGVATVLVPPPGTGRAGSSSPLRGVATRVREQRANDAVAGPHRPYEGSQHEVHDPARAQQDESSSPLRGVATPHRGRLDRHRPAQSSSPLRGVATTARGRRRRTPRQVLIAPTRSRPRSGVNSSTR